MRRPAPGLNPGPAHVLVVGGEDPSNGAGVTVDRAAVLARGGTCAIVATARTDQDDREVRSVGARPAERWFDEALGLADAHAGAEDGAPLGLKFGLLPGAEHVLTAARLVSRLREGFPGLPVVVDPVIESSSGHVFLDLEAREELCRTLLPLGVVLTPNLPEAAWLAGDDPSRLIDDPEARWAAARRLLAMGAHGVVLKGGHGTGQSARDLVLERGAGEAWIEHERIAGPGIRGSGCRHASVVACELARGEGLVGAAREAATYVADQIRASAGAS